LRIPKIDPNKIYHWSLKGENFAPVVISTPIVPKKALGYGMMAERRLLCTCEKRKIGEVFLSPIGVYCIRLGIRTPVGIHINGYLTISRKDRGNMFTKIGTITIGVSDQDKALDFYVHKLGFEKVDDQPMSETERWLEIALPGTQTHIMLGLRGQSGGTNTGMTGFVLHADNIEETCATLKARGVTLTQELTTEPWGKWAQFTDLDNNEFGIWAPAW
jgi:lactoylglutathione lyase